MRKENSVVSLEPIIRTYRTLQHMLHSTIVHLYCKGYFVESHRMYCLRHCRPHDCGLARLCWCCPHPHLAMESGLVTGVVLRVGIGELEAAASGSLSLARYPFCETFSHPFFEVASTVLLTCTSSPTISLHLCKRYTK